jgi:glycerophosphoryl diester phosphodiesterase
MTLDEVVSRYGDELPLFIEPKGVPAGPGMLGELVRCLCATTGGHNHAVLAHQPRNLEAVQKECPEIVPVLLLDRGHRAADLRVAAAARIGARLSPHKDLVDARLVAQAHWNDVAVYPHTVNHPGEIKRLVEVGVDGVITDLPDHALLVRERLMGQLSPAVPA